MAKAIVYSKRSVLQGVFSNKKNLWEDIEKTNGGTEDLMMFLFPTKSTYLTYPKLTKHLKSRTMLNIYNKDDMEKPMYQVWEVEMNKHYEKSWD